MMTSWPGLVPLGLATNGAALLLGVALGGHAAVDRVFLGAEAVAVLLAAWALRDWQGFPSEGLAAVGLVAYALLEVGHFATSLGGMPPVALAVFGVYVLGAVTAAVGAVWWQRTLAGSAAAVHTMRVGCALVSVSYLGYVTLGRASVSGLLLSLLGALGMALVAWAFAPGTEPDAHGTPPVVHSS